MSSAIAPPEINVTNSSRQQRSTLGRNRHQQTAPLLVPVRSILKEMILMGLAVGLVLILSTALMPAVFLIFMLFFPALAPMALVGLGILCAADTRHAKDGVGQGSTDINGRTGRGP